MCPQLVNRKIDYESKTGIIKKNIVYPPIHYDYELKEKTLEIQDWPRESVEDLGGLEARGCAHFTKKKMLIGGLEHEWINCSIYLEFHHPN